MNRAEAASRTKRRPTGTRQKPPKAPPDVQAPPAAEPAAPSPAKHPQSQPRIGPGLDHLRMPIGYRTETRSHDPPRTDRRPGKRLGPRGPNPAMALSAMLEVARAKQLLNEDGHLVDENGDLLKKSVRCRKSPPAGVPRHRHRRSRDRTVAPLTDTPSPRPVGRLFFRDSIHSPEPRHRRPFHSTHSRNIESGRAQIRSGRSTER